MEIRPFAGWRYRTETGDVSALVAPPYDILDADDKRRLLERSERNIVAVDLPHVPPKELGPPQAYAESAGCLRAWQAQGVVAQEDAPALYVYDQTYTWAGKTHTRRAMLVGVRATPLGEDVLPHEHTFAGPKADRLRLTELTRTQMSPIFGFYADPGGKAQAMLEKAVAGPPDCSAELDETREALWVVTDPDIVNPIADVLANQPAYIADGHHRYTTALNYIDGLSRKGELPPDHPARFVMFALVASSDPGLVVLPTHRMLSGVAEGFTPAKLAEALGDDFELCPWPAPTAGLDFADADAVLAPHGPGAMAMLWGEEIWLCKLRNAQAMQAARPDEPEAWRSLDVAVLHELIIDGALSAWTGEETDVTYSPHGQTVRQACREGSVDLAFCVQGTPVETVQAIADAGATMPHKSTYFYPKLTTGMVLKPLA